jgi:hypothetical protein
MIREVHLDPATDQEIEMALELCRRHPGEYRLEVAAQA